MVYTMVEARTPVEVICETANDFINQYNEYIGEFCYPREFKFGSGGVIAVDHMSSGTMIVRLKEEFDRRDNCKECASIIDLVGDFRIGGTFGSLSGEVRQASTEEIAKIIELEKESGYEWNPTDKVLEAIKYEFDFKRGETIFVKSEGIGFKRDNMIVRLASDFREVGSYVECVSSINFADEFKVRGNFGTVISDEIRLATDEECQELISREAQEKLFWNGKDFEFEEFNPKLNLKRDHWYDYNGWILMVKGIREDGIIRACGFSDKNVWHDETNFGDSYGEWEPVANEKVVSLLLGEAKRRGFMKGAEYSPTSSSSVNYIAKHDPKIFEPVEGCQVRLMCGMSQGLIFNRGHWGSVKYEGSLAEARNLKEEMNKLLEKINKNNFINITEFTMTCQ
jgi:hypothetical protein